MALLCAIVFLFKIPNPNMILISCLVITTALFGWHIGIASAAVMFLYSSFFFSTDYSLIYFTAQNLQKLLVVLVGETLVLVFVGRLKQAHDSTVAELRELNEILTDDNKILAEASMADQLTGLRNRYALRRDYDSFSHRDLVVMMMDADDFKHFNDAYSHDVGDYVLSEIGANLTEVFGAESCYRYGGDEFLVISDLALDEFKKRINKLDNLMDDVRLDGSPFPVPISGGYVYGRSLTSSDLRSMIHEADVALYAAKAAGKHRFNGKPFVRLAT
ncbi:MAG: GGDEF domain-containing protein [Oscillospiraceae bacterium]|nr:GGDEF domain-containing protein [Oscillospiraceae bacterium]